jgi:pimeloyl-ACP methyl ester carboxylesterase
MAGEGPPLLCMAALFPAEPAVHRGTGAALAGDCAAAPGLGVERPDGFRTVHDLAYLYLDMLDRRDLGTRNVRLIVRRWIALEICVRCVERIGRLALIDTLGIKFGGREERDIADIYALPAEELLRRTFFEPGRIVPDYTQLADDEAMAIARDRAATALYGWKPYMHDPGLRQWLHRVRVPTLVVWGENDGIVAPTATSSAGLRRLNSS